MATSAPPTFSGLRSENSVRWTDNADLAEGADEAEDDEVIENIDDEYVGAAINIDAVEIAKSRGGWHGQQENQTDGQGDQASSNYRQQARQPIRCYNCGVSGHPSRLCNLPYDPNSSFRPPWSSYRGPGGQAGPGPVV